MRTLDTPESPWCLYLEDPDEQLQDRIKPKHLDPDDSILPYASFPSLPLEYQMYNPHDECRYGKVTLHMLICCKHIYPFIHISQYVCLASSM